MVGLWIEITTPGQRARSRIATLGWAASVLAVASCSSSAEAACKGEDLLNRMATEVPADYASIEADARAMPFGHGVLFRIQRSGLASSFLFGTLHVVDPMLTALSEAQLAALRSSREVALESLDFEDAPAGPQALAPLSAPEASRASRLLSPAAFRDLRALTVRRGFPPELADRIKPSALALMLDLPPCAGRKRTGPTFPDALVAQEARSLSLPVSGLETTAEQVSIADDLPLDVQTALLSAVVAQSREAESVVETSVKLYRQGRLGELLAWTRSMRPIVGIVANAIPPQFFDRILDARTRRMRDRLLPTLSKGGLFVAIGANHIPGRTGLAALLTSEGYTVETIE